jgi:peptidoglycan/LPS O-acetylase OafA/YrhL
MRQADLRLDVARGVAALVALAAHNGQVFWWRVPEGESEFLFTAAANASDSPMRAFFLISGFVIVRSRRSRPARSGLTISARWAAATHFESCWWEVGTGDARTTDQRTCALARDRPAVRT